MRPYHAATVLLFFLCGCAAPPSAVTDEHIAYFGFATVDCFWDDPHDLFNKTNYVDEVAGFTNLAQLCVFSEQDLLEERLGAFRKFGLKALLSVEPLLFERQPDLASPGGERLTLSSQAQARWAAFVGANKTWLTSEYVAAVHLADGPFRNGVPEADFAEALGLVKASLPTLPTAATEAYPLPPDLVVPEDLGWLGFGRNGHLDPGDDPLWLADIETLRAKLKPGQKLVVVADTQWLPRYDDIGLSAADVAGVAESYLELARATPEAVALVGYPWAGGVDSPEQLGARDLPEVVLETLKSIGRRILEP